MASKLRSPYFLSSCNSKLNHNLDLTCLGKGLLFLERSEEEAGCWGDCGASLLSASNLSTPGRQLAPTRVLPVRLEA